MLGALPTKRTALGRELRAWREALVADVGGPETVSTQQRVLVEKGGHTEADRGLARRHAGWGSPESQRAYFAQALEEFAAAQLSLAESF